MHLTYVPHIKQDIRLILLPRKSQTDGFTIECSGPFLHLLRFISSHSRSSVASSTWRHARPPLCPGGALARMARRSRGRRRSAARGCSSGARLAAGQREALGHQRGRVRARLVERRRQRLGERLGARAVQRVRLALVTQAPGLHSRRCSWLAASRGPTNGLGLSMDMRMQFIDLGH